MGWKSAEDVEHWLDIRWTREWKFSPKCAFAVRKVGVTTVDRRDLSTGESKMVVMPLPGILSVRVGDEGLVSWISADGKTIGSLPDLAAPAKHLATKGLKSNPIFINAVGGLPDCVIVEPRPGGVCCALIDVRGSLKIGEFAFPPAIAPNVTPLHRRVFGKSARNVLFTTGAGVHVVDFVAGKQVAFKASTRNSPDEWSGCPLGERVCCWSKRDEVIAWNPTNDRQRTIAALRGRNWRAIFASDDAKKLIVCDSDDVGATKVSRFQLENIDGAAELIASDEVVGTPFGMNASLNLLYCGNKSGDVLVYRHK